jgi:hypothetical protein
LRPCAVKEENGEHGTHQQNKQRDLPPVAEEDISQRFVWAPQASKKFHRLEKDRI